MDSTATFEVVTNSVASFLNTDVNSLNYFLFKAVRRAHTGGKHFKPGVTAWIKAFANVSDYHMYPEVDHSTDYGHLTLEM